MYIYIYPRTWDFIKDDSWTVPLLSVLHSV